MINEDKKAFKFWIIEKCKIFSIKELEDLLIQIIRMYFVECDAEKLIKRIMSIYL